MKEKNKELSSNDNSLKYLIKLLILVLSILSVSTGVIAFIIYLTFVFWHSFYYKIKIPY